MTATEGEIETAVDDNADDPGQRATGIQTALNSFRADISGLDDVEGEADTIIGAVPITKDGEEVDTSEDVDSPATTRGEFETPTTLLAKIKSELDDDIFKDQRPRSCWRYLPSA